ncbi:unnamed protein product [Penicillium discolor]
MIHPLTPAMSSGTQSDTNPDEAMHLAVERFRAKMESSNRQFIQDRIEEIEAMHLSTEDEKLHHMLKYWADLDIKDLRACNDDAPRDIIRRVGETANVSRLEDLKTIFHERMDGIIPSTLVTDDWREMFLETVESVCNEAAEQDEDDENFHIPRCDELGHFLRYANGVEDPDFRSSGICLFEPVPFGFGIRDFAFPDRPSIQALPPPDIAKSREELRDQLQDKIIDEAFIYGTVDNDLEVKVGFKTGLGGRREHDECSWLDHYDIEEDRMQVKLMYGSDKECY